MDNEQGSKINLLWIEDQYQEYDPLYSELCNIFGNDHVSVKETETSGISFLKAHQVDLLILDIMIPKNEQELKFDLMYRDSGIRILQELRINKDWQTVNDCPVIIFTARGHHEALDKIILLLDSKGEIIQKPVPIELIIDAAKKWAERIKSNERKNA